MGVMGVWQVWQYSELAEISPVMTHGSFWDVQQGPPAANSLSGIQHLLQL